MSDPIEHLRWHEWARDAWTEKRPAPLDLSDKEVLDWIGEHAEQAVWSPGTDERTGCWNIYCDEFDGPARGKTLREAVKLAAAKLKEINQ